MVMDIRGKLALVTGGSDGIGREIALQLKDAGAQVIVTGRSAEKLAAMAAQGFGTIAGDLSEQQGIEAVVDGMAGKPLALLINNAGIGGSYLLDDPATLADANLCLRTNVEAPIALCTRLLPALRAQPEAMIVNVTSGLAIAPAGSGSVYSASKAALRAYTQALRYLLRDSDIHVAEALPPVVATNMTAARGGAKMTATDCAAEILRGIGANRAEINIGQVKLLQVVNSISPAFARRMLIKF